VRIRKAGKFGHERMCRCDGGGLGERCKMWVCEDQAQQRRWPNQTFSFFPTALKNLTSIHLPSRDLPLDLVLPAFSTNKIPLASLDLEGSSDLSDTGLASISGFASTLKSLSLAGIKTVSARALVALLAELNLTSLDLDRVACLSPPFHNTETNEEQSFANSLLKYADLETLSLTQTGVSDISLEIWNGGPAEVPEEEAKAGASGLPAYRLHSDREASFKRIVRKLNLSRCSGVTDKGVRVLAGKLLDVGGRAP